jgi:hypothetical protein
MSDERKGLSAFLARHEPPCPHCERRIKVLAAGAVCPECGCGVTLRGVLVSMAKPRPTPWLVLLDAVIVLLLVWSILIGVGPSGHMGRGDLVCVSFAVWFGLVVVRVAVRRRAVVAVLPEDPPLPAEYLAGVDVPCPKCGYNLRDQKGEVCPECGKALSVQALHEDALSKSGLSVSNAIRPMVTAVAVTLCVLIATALVGVGVYLMIEKWSFGPLLIGAMAVPVAVVVVRTWLGKGKEGAK